MAASAHSLTLTPKSLSIRRCHSSSAALFTQFFFKSTPKLHVALSFTKSLPNLNFVLVPKCSISHQSVEEVDEQGEEDEALDFSDLGVDEPSFPPEQKLFVGNLPFSIDSQTLAGLFQEAGSVEEVEVIYDKSTGRSRGFGFVTMSSVEEAETAARRLNGYELEGRPLRVNNGPPPPKRDSLREFSGSRANGFNRLYVGNREPGRMNDMNKLYVGNLAWDVDNGTLENFFSEQGQVVDARVICDRDSGRSRGFGFVTYNSSEEVDRAIAALNGADLNGRSVRVSPAESRAVR